MKLGLHRSATAATALLHLKFLFFAISVIFVVVEAEMGDEHCCRKRIECFECDSRFDARCGDTFNLTRETGTLIHCNDLCVKLKHRYGNQYYYVRSCADTFKKVYIKKTEVCYTTRDKNGGYLCFCDEDLCNEAATITSRRPSKYNNLIALSAIFYYFFGFSSPTSIFI
jgi:hypothetical protein